MNAETLTKALGGRWSGSSGSAACPTHEDKTPRLSGAPCKTAGSLSGPKTGELPENIKQIILAADNAAAGQGIIQETALRLAGQGREVRVAKLPTGRDWVDVLDSYEERAGILEFDLEIYRSEAEAQARREAINE